MREYVDGPVRVRVPASSANLGPGFDSLGVAHGLHDVVLGEVSGAELVITAEGEGAVQAGYDALRAAKLPEGIKIFEKMTIGDPKGTFEDSRIPTKNGANGVGLEYFGAGSTLADEMVMTWIEGEQSYTC